MTAILGLSADRGDTAAVIIVDDRVVAAVRDRDIAQGPTGAPLPLRAARAVLDSAGLHARDLDLIAVGGRPLRRFERELVGHVLDFPRGAGRFARGMFSWLGERLWLRARIAATLEVEAQRVAFVEQSRALAAASGTLCRETAAALICEDGAEWTTTTSALVTDERVLRIEEQRFPDGWSVMAGALVRHLDLATEGGAARCDRIAASHLPDGAERLAAALSLAPDGTFRCTSSARSDRNADAKLARCIEAVFGPPRGGATPPATGSEAAAVLEVLTRAALAATERLFVRTRARGAPTTLALAGDLARWPRVVAALAERGPFERVVAPRWSGGDALALGAALVAMARTSGRMPRLGPEGDALGSGPLFDTHTDGAIRSEAAAELVAQGARVAWVHGRMGYGSHSAGTRAALADPRASSARAELLAALQRGPGEPDVWLAMRPEDAARGLESLGAARDSAAQGTVALRASHALAERARGALDADGRLRVLVVAPDAESGLDRVLESAAALGLPGLLVADLARAGGITPRLAVDARDLVARSKLDALFVEGRAMPVRSGDGTAREEVGV